MSLFSLTGFRLSIFQMSMTLVEDLPRRRKPHRPPRAQAFPAVDESDSASRGGRSYWSERMVVLNKMVMDIGSGQRFLVITFKEKTTIVAE